MSGGSETERRKVLIAGAGGLLGRALVEGLPARGFEVLGLDRTQLDVLDPAACRAALARHRPRVVLNCAAYTAVDNAEDEEARARAINVDGSANLAAAAAEAGARIIYFSTDFVFDGRQDRPYAEDDPPAPLNAYGRSKWAGEAATRKANPEHLILRTAWLFGPHGDNFIRKILKLGREKGELNVVDDQVGSPTYSLDLVEGLARILDLDLKGTFHLANSGQTSWFGLAQSALRTAGIKARLHPVPSGNLGRKAVRPAFSVLDCGRLKGLGVELRPWPEALAGYLGRWPEG